MKRRLNKWQFVWSNGKDFMRGDRSGWRHCTVGIIKLKNIPPEGARLLDKENYNGILFDFFYWLPIERAW